MPDLEITDVRFAAPQLDEPDIERGERRAWTQVSISLLNRSPSTTYYVRADLCALRYDDDAGTLGLLLAEPPPIDGVRTTFRVQPNFLPVLPESVAVIEGAIPLQLKGIDPAAADWSEARTIDISALRHAEVTLTHDATPFRPVYTDSNDYIQKQLHDWGTRLEYSTACRLPPPEEGAAPLPEGTGCGCTAPKRGE